MLLRLLPSPSPSQPTPPTILFTLPLPTHPYSGRSLPLPPNLLAHKTVCLHEDIDCSNVLLGEKSTWISGIIDDITFSLPLQNVRIHFIDGSATTLPLDKGCNQSLARVVEQVNLSFAPKPTTTRASMSAPSRSAPSTPRRSSTSALLLTLLSPLLPTSTSSSLPSRIQSSDPQYASRMHRRQARSLLVDSYRRYVLPQLKDSLPSAYLTWAIESEVAQRTIEYENIKLEINSVLASTGYDATPTTARDHFAHRARSSTSSTASSASASDSECDETPLSSLHSRCSSPRERLLTASPHAFLLAIPPAHQLPSAYRSIYSHQLAELTRIASRLSSIKRLDVQYEREESKRRWLETLERGKAGERSLRRAWSNGQSRVKHSASYYKPNRSSSLWRSWTADDVARQDKVASSYAIHPAMMEEDSDAEHESVADSDSMMSVDEPMVVTPRKAVFDADICVSGTASIPTPTRPALLRKAVPCDVFTHDEHEVSHGSTSSDENGDDDDDIETVPLPVKHKAFTLPPVPPRPEKWAAIAPPPLIIPITIPVLAKQTARGIKTKLAEWVRSDRDRDRGLNQQHSQPQQELAVLPILY